MPNLTALNKEQRQAVIHGEGPLLIIAGAGTGKTTVITKRIEHLIQEKNVSPGNILALTFTEKAAQEMETRIDESLPYGYSTMWIETFHAFCDRILKQEAINIGLNPKFRMMTESESLLFLKKNIFTFELDYFRPLGNPMKFLQGLLQHFSRLKDDDISPNDYVTFVQEQEKNPDIDQDELKRIQELAHAYKAYETLKTKESVMDFSDLISNTLTLFRSRPHILKEYQKLFTYILVDEFQDTNYAQNELAILLAGDQQNITVVGDDDQSIYRWRGAALANMMQFRSHFPKATIVTLNKNYRSEQIILDSAYDMIQHNNPDRLEAKEAINKQLTSMKESTGGKVDFIYANRGEEEAEMVAKKIREEVKKSHRPYNEFAILVRANDHSTPFQRALDRMNIPYQFLGPGHLFEQEEIKDLVSYLRALANFEDNASFYRVITMPIFNLEARDVATILNYAKKNNCSLFEAMEQSENMSLTQNGKDKVDRIITIMKKHLEKLPKETAGQILYYFFEDSGLLGHYLDPQTIKTEKEAENIALFFEKLQGFAANREDASVFAVVDWIDLSMDLGESPLAAEVDWSKNNAVNILTIHSSKGLEFPVVFVVNLVTQRFPGRDRKEQIPVPRDLIKEVLPTGDAHLQEERRLFYVAMTRAKETLYLSAARFYNEGKRERKLSPFIIEALGDAYIQNILKNQTIKQEVQQLSLLDIANENIANEKKEDKTGVEKHPHELHYISYSQLQTFQICPLHYKLRYILNVPTPASPALSYGVSVHSSLRDFFQQLKEQKTVTSSDMKQLLNINWIKLGYAGKLHEEQAYKQAESMLTEYAQKILADQPDTLAIELPFNFYLDTLKVGGRIDRIDQLPDGRIEIIDYKTGRNIPDEKKIKDDLQLSFYALAATEIKDNFFSKVPEEIVLSLYYIEEDKKISTVRSKADLELAKEKILTLVENISQSDFQCSGGMLCKNCEYKMICQTRTK